MNDYSSDLEKVIFEVPQGSILGQRLFSVYVNDLRMLSFQRYSSALC